MTGVVGARTSMAVASEIAMKRRRETDDAMRTMRRGMDDIAVVLHCFWRFGRLKGYATMSKFVGDAKRASGVATLRVSSPDIVAGMQAAFPHFPDSCLHVLYFIRMYDLARVCNLDRAAA